MNNPFELIEARLASIESLLQNLNDSSVKTDKESENFLSVSET